MVFHRRHTFTGGDVQLRQASAQRRPDVQGRRRSAELAANGAEASGSSGHMAGARGAGGSVGLERDGCIANQGAGYSIGLVGAGDAVPVRGVQRVRLPTTSQSDTVFVVVLADL